MAALEIERQAARPTPKFDGSGSLCSDLPSLQRYRQDVIGGCRHPRALAIVYRDYRFRHAGLQHLQRRAQLRVVQHWSSMTKGQKQNWRVQWRRARR